MTKNALLNPHSHWQCTSYGHQHLSDADGNPPPKCMVTIVTGFNTRGACAHSQSNDEYMDINPHRDECPCGYQLYAILVTCGCGDFIPL